MDHKTREDLLKKSCDEYLRKTKQNCATDNHYYGYWIRTGEDSGSSMAGTKKELKERNQKHGTCIFCKAEYKHQVISKSKKIKL